MISDYHIDEFLMLATLPMVIAAFWVFHAVLRFRRSRKANVTFWILIAGLPVTGVLLFLLATTMPSPYSGLATMSGPGFAVMLWSFAAVLRWVLVMILEAAILVILGTMDMRTLRLNDRQANSAAKGSF